MGIKIEEDPKMSNPSSPKPSGNQSLQLLISQEDHDNKFFSKLLTKEKNPSFRVYYGGLAGSVPFTWESEPGTPKHAFFMATDNRALPPLTPPPSSFRSTVSESNRPSRKLITVRRSGGFFHRLLRRMGIMRSSSSIVSSTASSSSLLGFVPVKPLEGRNGMRRFSSQGSFESITPLDDDEGEENIVKSPRGRPCFCVGPS